MVLFAAALAVLAFLIGFSVFRIVDTAKSTVKIARDATGVIGDKSLSDDEKEAAVQKAALAMVRAAFSVFWRVAALLLGTVAPIYLLQLLGLVDAGAVFSFLARPSVIIGASVIVGGAVWLWSRRRRNSAKADSAYSALDRLVHRVAFAAPFVQGTAADMEDSSFKAAIAEIDDTPPIFITSLPRAGTTVMLNALHDVPGVATHLYRDMPFIMAPMMWARLSSGFSKQAELKERAHGDGIKVGYDSPEAFEEVLWRHFWPDHFKGSSIPLWHESDFDAEAQDFMRRHFRKIVALRTGPGGRYVSKNNGNIARLALLQTMFPGAEIVVPLRHPAEHAASLLRQHLNFQEQHARDPFVKRYMRDIGHLEFGALHTPIAFEGFKALSEGLSPEQPDYWLAYWLAANLNVQNHLGHIHVVAETQLQADPQGTMAQLCQRIGITPGDTNFGAHIKPIPHRADQSVFDPALLKRALALYEELNKAGQAALKG